MTKTNLLWRLLILSTTFVLLSCVKDTTDQPTGSEPDDRIESKLIFTSDNAVEGELLIYFNEQAMPRVETAVAPVTRSGGVATRSGIDTFDAVLNNVGIESLERIFPIDERNEERTRAAGLHRWYIVKFNAEVDLDDAARKMAEVAEVSKVEFNQQLMHIRSNKVTPLDETIAVAQTRATPQFNDPQLSKQWHYINTGDPKIYSKAKAGADVNCGEAWKLTQGDPRIIVAVVDDCVQWDHPDLAANMWVNPREGETGYTGDKHGYNFVKDSPLTISTKDGDHGTHVAGTVAAVNNNGIGVCGVAGGSGKNDGVKIMSCQVFYNNTGGEATTTSKAIKYAADNGAAIIQCSFGFPAGTITSDTRYESSYSVEKQTIDYFTATKNCDAIDGGLAIFAAGNDGGNISSYPGAYKDYISVTSMSCDYTPAYYTNYGPGCNIAAPGGDAYQSYLENNTETSQVLSTFTKGKYGYMQGTSMACPHASGVAALGLSYALKLGKTFTLNEFKSLLLTSVNDINKYCTGTKQYATETGQMATLSLTKHKNHMGSGYIDAFQVLMNVRGITCLPISVGDQNPFDLQPYLGGGSLGMKILSVDISAEDMTRLGIAAKPTIFANKILFKCTKPGSAIVKIKLLAGEGNNSGMNGMEITKEFALIVREAHAENGGWL